MKNFIALFLFFIFSLTPHKANSTAFIEGFEDVPLMDGLTQLKNQDFSFGNEETGFTEIIATAAPDTDFSKVKTFYQNILPQLGWKLKSTDKDHLTLIRESDILEITQINRLPLKISISLKSKN